MKDGRKDEGSDLNSLDKKTNTMLKNLTIDGKDTIKFSSEIIDVESEQKKGEVLKLKKEFMLSKSGKQNREDHSAYQSGKRKGCET